jgi:site-specific DNA recombinase
MKSECEEKINRIEAKLFDFTQQIESDIDIENIVNQAVGSLRELVYLYKEADVKGKQFIIGSIFPEKWVFSDSKGRTGQINEAAQLVYQINSALDHKKTGVKANFRNYSGFVPSAGVEPARFPTGV